MGRYISPEFYNKYKKQVLDMSLATQYYIGLQQQRKINCLSDKEIASKLGLSEDIVTEIRTIAYNDLIPADTWIKSDEEKKLKCNRYFGKHFKKYIKD